MKKRYLIQAIYFLTFLIFMFTLNSSFAHEKWNAKWITAQENQNATNTWIAFHKDFSLGELPKTAIAKIAVDSKYWLWINGELVVFEGQLKRGPTPKDTYYDELDIAPFLKPGKNQLAILLWYFGKDGFSHKSSGGAALIFDCQTPQFNLYSEETWKAILHPSFGNTDAPYPNYRLPESNILFDARKGELDFMKSGFDSKRWRNARLLGKVPSAPWNNLVKSPIPLWKDFGLKEYVDAPELPFTSTGETIVCKLPYNAQVTPWFEISTLAGQMVKIQTDHYKGGGPNNVRAEYITRKGKQSYENLGWMNGHEVHYTFPAGVEVLDLKFRETGYNTEFSGYFSCSDPFFDKLWQKAVRTLYVTMRDTYMDCPDRERAQWWGDAVNESGETFYALSPSSHLLTKKAILELINWQREDSTIFSPVPAGNYDRELPGQMLASVGYYGFWNYYLNTGDKETIEKVYEGVKRYLGVWTTDERGVLNHRQGGWYWGDWGRNSDKALLMHGWYYLALEGFKNMSELLEKKEEVLLTEQTMEKFKSDFNKAFWQGDHYRSDAYKGEIDDRSQALAVVAGLADSDKYKAIFKLLQTQKYASPYMEKYVIEALVKMDQVDFALTRMKERFSEMVNHPEISTLWEGWGIGKNGFGGGSANHAWSGGGLTILAQYICGLEPIESGWKKFKVHPRLAKLEYAETGNETIAGEVSVKVERKNDTFSILLSVPEESKAVVYIPEIYKSIKCNGTLVFNKSALENETILFKGSKERCNTFETGSGTFEFIAR